MAIEPSPKRPEDHRLICTRPLPVVCVIAWYRFVDLNVTGLVITDNCDPQPYVQVGEAPRTRFRPYRQAGCFLGGTEGAALCSMVHHSVTIVWLWHDVAHVRG